MSSPARRVRENATGIVSVVVTGIWLAALFLDQGWWLAFMLFGYVVLVPVTAILFDDESEMERWWDRETGEAGAEKTAEELYEYVTGDDDLIGFEGEVSPDDE